MSIVEGLLRDIIENPHDDTPRRVYADWLDEHGDAARAEFILVQIGLEGLGPDDPRRGDLEERELSLEAADGEAWRAALPALPGVDWGCFRRGFVEEVSFRNGRAFLAHAPAAFAAAPVRTAYIKGLTPRTGPDVARSPHLGRLASLYLTSLNPGEETVRALAASPHIAGLTTLNLYDVPVGDTGAEAFASSPHLGGITSLRLGAAGIGPAGAAALAGSRCYPRLTVLGLGGNELGETGAVALATSLRLPRLASLDLSFNALGSAGAAALVSSPSLPRLTSLC